MIRSPVHGVVQGDPERDMLLAVVDRQWYTHSVYTTEFEKRIREYIGVEHAAFCNSGSSANLLALSTLADHEIPGDRRIKRGDEVITTAIAFATTLAPIVQVGAVPVLIDIEPDLTVSADKIEQAITEKTKAVFLTHTLGIPFDAASISELCDRYHLWLIEDTCDALGSSVSGRMCGSWGDLATLSFFPAHTITTGEGGMVMSDNADLMKIARSYRDWGRACWCKPGQDNACGHRFANGKDHKYTYNRLGYNLKGSDLHAAIGIAQMDRLPGFVQRRRANYQYLYERLGGIPLPDGASPFAFTVEVDNASRLSGYLEKHHVGVRPMFGIDTDTLNGYNYRMSHAPNAEILNAHMVWVGCWPGLTNEQLDHTVDTIGEYDKCRLKTASS
jgi:CDP-4-dehydro-6-deoxyglucose reductase, E1